MKQGLPAHSMCTEALAGQAAFVENLFLAAMSIGLSMFAAQYMGKEDYLAAERVFAYVMKAAVTISVVFFLAGLCIPEILMRIFTDEQVLINGGAVYLRIVSVSFLLTGISQICLCMLKNSGRAAKAGIISSVSVIINIVLNAVFIFGLFGVPEIKYKWVKDLTVKENENEYNEKKAVGNACSKAANIHRG